MLRKPKGAPKRLMEKTTPAPQLSEKSRQKLEDARDGLGSRLEEIERNCLKELASQMKTTRGVECRLATINANRIRDQDKRDALDLFLLDFLIDVCVVSETHMREGEIVDIKKYLLEYGYRVEAQCCRKTGGARIRGGVIILAHERTSAVGLSGIPLPRSPVDACGISVFPTDLPSDQLRITGVYCPPPVTKDQKAGKGESSRVESAGVVELEEKFKPNRKKMEMLLTRKLEGGRGEETCGHLVVGDLNPTAWEEEYQLWIAEQGAWELTDPSKATHRRGGAMDKIVFQPWGNVPDCFLESTKDGGGGDTEWIKPEKNDLSLL